jgi:multicomponent K+:H+ antiporter subunit F
VIETTLTAVTVMIGIAMVLCAFRLLRGPDLPDRILALDTLYINTLALLFLQGIREGSTIHFEAGLVIAMLGFVGTVVLAKYAIRRDIIE